MWTAKNNFGRGRGKKGINAHNANKNSRRAKIHDHETIASSQGYRFLEEGGRALLHRGTWWAELPVALATLIDGTVVGTEQSKQVVASSGDRAFPATPLFGKKHNVWKYKKKKNVEEQDSARAC